MATHDGRPGAVDFTVIVTGSETRHHVSVAGELDISTAGHLRTALAHARAREVVVDVSRLSFIDAVGVSSLVLGHRAAADSGAQFVVEGARGAVRRVRELAGVGHLMGGGVAAR
jgi:anti-anti-sigma factor